MEYALSSGTVELEEKVAQEARPRKESSNPAFFQVLRLRNFRLLWIGEGISLLGDQCYLIALPWLVLQLTGSALAMGTVLALAGIPRALFMLVGGALTDRFSPRTLMLGSNLMRLLLVAALSSLVLTGFIQLWMLYTFALLFGLADAFFYPAQSAIVPQLVGKDGLQAGNAIIQGTGQLALFLGPVAAGLLIALVDGSHPAGRAASSTVPDLGGIGLAFALDAVSFLFSAATLWMIRPQRSEETAGESNAEKGLLASIHEGLASVWNDVPLRSFFLLIAAINLLVVGPIVVGIPFLANSRLAEGAAAFGIIMSAYGGGSLLGTLLAGVLPRPAGSRMSLALLLACSSMGIELATLGLSSSTMLSAAISLAMGAAQGYTVILFVTWLQLRTPEAMLGRTMGLLMFAAIGLTPLSTALAGALVALNPTVFFATSGGLMTVVVLLSALSPSVRTMGFGEVGKLES